MNEHEHDHTLSPNLRSWVESANDPTTDFPPQNLPLCSFINPQTEDAGIGMRIGDKIVQLSVLHDAGLIDDGDHHNHNLCEAVQMPTLNYLLREVPQVLSDLRRRVQNFILEGDAGGQSMRRLRQKALVSADEVMFLPPSMPANYTDFYASVHHATTVGSMFRPENPLLPNYKYVPIGYHGRASSIVPSGITFPRPKGQTKKDDAPGAPFTPPTFGPSAMMDYELEMGVIIAEGNDLGEPIAIKDARKHMAGLTLVNDWSARDFQKWEYQPLGPFLAKNFATSVGDCMVTMDALAPFRCAAYARPAGDPAPLDYLFDEQDQKLGGFDITLEVSIRTKQMREKNMMPFVTCTGRAFREMYWTLAQLVTHHTSNGCPLQPGDLIASGTISGPASSERGCLLESTWQGRDAEGKVKPRKAIELPSGEKRIFLEDGDEVILRGWCEREGYRRIGFGRCAGMIEG
jgi:fumarylacetoacetase